MKIYWHLICSQQPHLLDRMFQAKYMQEIRVKRGWSYGAYGSIDSRRDGGSYYLYTFPKNEDTVDAIALSLELFGSSSQWIIGG
ncbi:MAG: hypothetical protein R2877_04520 [Bdellovibrionota bacterium]